MNIPIKRNFDKSISSSWYKQLACLAAILVLFFLPSLFFALICKEFKVADAIEVYMDPGNFCTKVNNARIDDGVLIRPEKRDIDTFYWAFLITAFAGAAAFAGVLISMCGNFIQQRVEKFKKGYVKYKFENHNVILGYNDMVPALVKQIINDDFEKSDRKIVLMTSHDVEAVRELLFTNLDKAERKKLVLVHGSRLSAEALENIHISKAKSIYLIGEDDDVDHDTLNINSLEVIASQNHETRKIPCVTYLRNQSTFALFRTSDIMDDVREKIDFLPFSFDETWAAKVLVGCESKINKIKYQSLDRSGIGKDSEKHVHLIVIGMSQMGIMFGMEAAQICHFPNFKTKGKKTKITFIDENADTEMRFVVSAHDRFFRNCRYVYFDENHSDSEIPDNDFLDVEFEFLKGNIADVWVRNYIEKCAGEDNEILTIASCMNDTAKSLAAGLYLPDIVYDKGLSISGKENDKKGENEVVVLVRQNTSAELLNIIKNGNAKYKKYRNVYPFGMLNDGYELDETLDRWAKRMNYLYCVFDELKGVPSLYPDDIIKDKWNDCSVSDKWSNYYNVMTIPTKLRSVGIDYKSLTLRYLTDEEIETLAEVEHNRWNVERLLMGFRPVTDEEVKEIDKDISNKSAYKNTFKAHYDIRPFGELKPDASGLNVNRYDYGMTKGIIDIIKN